MTKTPVSLALSVNHLSANLSSTLFEINEKNEQAQQDFIGHERAKEALAFGLSMKANGFNVFAVGEHGTGRQTLIKQMLNEMATQEETPYEWCYINNFDDNHAPFTLQLNQGEGKHLLTRLNTFIDELMGLFPEIFDNPGYQRQKASIDREFNAQYDQAISLVEQTALKKNIILFVENDEVCFSPYIDGKPVSDKEFVNASEEQRVAYELGLVELEELLSEQLLELPAWKRISSTKMRQLKNETAEQSIRPLMKELEHEFSNNIGVLKYLNQVKENIVDAVLELLVDESTDTPRDDKSARKLMVERFLPNLLISKKDSLGAPVIYEQNPTYQNLFGYVDFATFQGGSYTSYRLIRPGALHKANGGYLLLDAEKLLQQPMVWAQLKLALKTQQITIENPYAELSQLSGQSLQPEKIPLKLKVVLLGDPEIYYSLQEYDQEFTELFRVLADFDRHLSNDQESLIAYSNLIRQRAKKLNYPEISATAIVELILYALRRAEHQHKISANIVQVNDLLDEAHYLWQKDNHLISDGVIENNSIQAEHILAALSAKERRTGRLSETWLSEINEQQLLISTQGKQVGKVNGLTVLEIGDSVFGTPARITATVYAGSSGVTDIEREAELGKAIHSKGVMLLTGYLGHKYGQSFPVSISANIAIEQSYGYIDGDSASMAELCALISAIINVPIDQGIAITGSINQHGEVQSIGGVNEKIEGFYRLCKGEGLTGQQGVIIPRTNVVNLMLSHDVIDAVEAGNFTIYAVDDIDQALGLLMGADAGVMNSVGRYPRRSIHGLVLEKLSVFSDILNGSDE